MIELKNVRKRYWRRNILKDVSFTAEKGQITCLIGVNGAGKSTILKAIMGLTPIHAGSIRISDQPLRTQAYENISFIPDHCTLPLAMQLSDGLQFMQDFYQSWNPYRAEELMQFFRLNPSDRIGHLSKGTLAKYNLVLGFAQNTDYVLMDEPFSGIDMFTRELIAEVFTSELTEHRGILLTTHEIGEIEHLIDKAVMLSDGTISRQFNCEQIRSEEGKSVIDVMREVYLT